MIFMHILLCLLADEGSFACPRQQIEQCKCGCHVGPWSALNALCVFASLGGFAALAVSVSRKALQLSSIHLLVCCEDKHQ